MKKQKNINLKNVPKYKKIIVPIGLMVFMFWGIISGAVSVSKFDNYVKPYLFGFCFGIIGLLVGIYVAKRLRPFFTINEKIRNDYFGVIFLIASGFIGTFMITAHYLNTTLSSIEKCDNYPVVNKKYRKGGFRRAELNVLVININGNYYNTLSTHGYWNSILIGQEISVCYFKSKISFDYLALNDDK